MSYITKTVGDTTLLGILITKASAGVSGLTPTIEIRRNSDDLYLDFSALVAPFWVASGGQRELVLTEKVWQAGFYAWDFDQTTYGVEKADYTVVYRHNPPYRLVQVETLSYGNLAELDINLIRQHLENEQDLIQHSPTNYEHKIYDDTGAVGDVLIHHADITLDGNTEKRRFHVGP